MKEMAKKSILFVIAALLILLVFGSAGAGELEPEPGAGETEAGDASAEKTPEYTATRIDFEIAGHQAKRGLYVVQHPGGGELASWYALDGWEDSGWLEDINFVHEHIYVEVVYYPGPATEGTVMRILNHAPGSEHGWLSRGVAHALEVAWPDMPLAGDM